MAGVHHAISAAASAALGKKTLKEVVFDASGNFVVPANAINNTFYVGCTGGGGGGASSFNGEYALYRYGGGGSGRVTGVLTLTPGTTIPVTIGAGGTTYYDRTLVMYTAGNKGGKTSFGEFVSCLGGNAFDIRNSFDNNGVSGGGTGGSENTVYDKNYHVAGASSCPAMFTVDPTAIDNTNKFYEAKAYAYTNSTTGYHAGGAGCYWRGGELSTETRYARPNTGGGGVGLYGYSDTELQQMSGGSGKVVIYYYTYE